MYKIKEEMLKMKNQDKEDELETIANNKKLLMESKKPSLSPQKTGSKQK